MKKFAGNKGQELIGYLKETKTPSSFMPKPQQGRKKKTRFGEFWMKTEAGQKKQR